MPVVRKTGQKYLPVVWPGFSNANLSQGRRESNSIPRNCGAFLKAQLAASISFGARSVYVAMFDELNEGTAIMKTEPRNDRMPHEYCGG